MVWTSYAHDYNTFHWTPSNRNAHSGIDVATPFNTSITAPLAGRVIFAQCRAWGGQVDILGSWHGMTVVATVLHLHALFVSSGQSVGLNTVIGKSGGDARGPCATEDRYTEGPHTHLELTLGSVGPYHGKSPYRVTNDNHPIDPSRLISELNGITVVEETSPTGSITSASIGTLPVLASIFALPDATMQTLEQIPGIDGLIYRLHEAETYPGVKSFSDLLGAAAKFDAGAVAYWTIGNVIGNAKTTFVRGIYLGVGLLLFLGLLIAFASAQAEENIQVLEQVAPEVASAAAML